MEGKDIFGSILWVFVLLFLIRSCNSRNNNDDAVVEVTIEQTQVEDVAVNDVAPAPQQS